MAQWIPSVVLFVLFLINATIKRKLFCLSSILLLYESLTLASSVYFSYDPRVVKAVYDYLSGLKTLNNTFEKEIAPHAKKYNEARDGVAEADADIRAYLSS